MCTMKIVHLMAAYGTLVCALFVVTFCSPDNQADEAVNLSNDYSRWPSDENSAWSSQWSADELGPVALRPILKYSLSDLLRYNSRLKKTNVAPPPPGFVGARGRRAHNAAINELNEYLASNLAAEDPSSSSAFNAWLKHHPQRPSTNKKADLAMYKDGFIGARG